MRRMAPSDSEFRQSERAEPTDAQKTARIAIIRQRQRAERLGIFNIPRAIDSAYRRVSKEMDSMSNKLSLSKRDSLTSKSFGAAWPSEAAIPVDNTPHDNLAYNEDGTETWLRPEPYADYQTNFNDTMKELDSLVLKQESLEGELIALNANIAAAEAAGTITPDSEDVQEAMSTYQKLSAVRHRLNKLAVAVDEGVIERGEGRMGYRLTGAASGIAVTIGAFILWRMYRQYRPRRAGPRYTGTKDRLAVFGNIG